MVASPFAREAGIEVEQAGTATAKQEHSAVLLLT